MTAPILSFDEIKTPQKFEALVAAFFGLKKSTKKQNITNVEVKSSGEGPDGGVDILVEFMFSDGISEFKRRWVIQCKFHTRSISPAMLSDNNIPCLIHSYGADGYLLICRENTTQKLKELFDRLNCECRFKYRYELWTGEMFKTQLLIADKQLKKQFFPQYYKNEELLRRKTKKIV